MQRFNRSAHTPVGAAFFLFLGLAILPVSLRFAGVQISFSPRLSAAMDAYEQIAEAFGASSQPNAQLSVVRDLDSGPSNLNDASVCTQRELACAQPCEETTAKSTANQEPRALKASPARRISPRVALSSPLAARRTASVVVSRLENHALAIGALGASKLETITREELLKSIARQVRPSLEVLAEIWSAPIPLSRNMKVLVRTKRVAAASSAKSAERKAFTALDSARRRECDRAMLTSAVSANPDNSEF